MLNNFISKFIMILGDEMASSIIHIAVAKEINKVLNRKESNLLIGTIAPDISKLLVKTK